MARALLEGGTDEQQTRWLPQIASGQTLCAVSVTEPNTGSDVASVALKATKVDGGWRLNGGKTWCTYAGAAGALLVLARTNPDAKPAHKGLSLFVVEKPTFDSHDFEYEQPQGGRNDGSCHSDVRVSRHAVRSRHGLRGTFSRAGRLLDWRRGRRGREVLLYHARLYGRTSTDCGRACSLMRATFEESLSYSQDRMVFGRSVASYPLSTCQACPNGRTHRPAKPSLPTLQA